MPDSTSNFEESQGYVSYMISPKPGLAEETNIENTASIYFDTNPPVVTNTTENLMVSELPIPLTTQELPQGQFQLSLFPNPTTGELQIVSKDLNQMSLELTDFSGRILLQQKFNYSLTLNLATYPSGLYFIRFIKDGTLITKKIVKY
ncbi:MAG: T9SS type A sorting domain-containing protein [Saprospiraceae bacterium]